MQWSLSFKTTSDETIIEDSSKAGPSVLGPTYTVFLTNNRVHFRFNAIGSSMTQTFSYEEIKDARVATRLLIAYLCISTKEKEFYIHTPNPGLWATRILELRKKRLAEPVSGVPKSIEAGRLKELKEMLDTLHRYHLLTTAEVEQKKKLLARLRP